MLKLDQISLKLHISSHLISDFIYTPKDSKDEHKRIIRKIGFTLDYDIKSLIHPLNEPQHYRCW